MLPVNKLRDMIVHSYLILTGKLGELLWYADSFLEKSPSIKQFFKKVVVSRNQANSYLRHPRSVTEERMDNATEECCKESCTYDEIAEYDC